MSERAISVNKLGKRYVIGEQVSYRMLREALTGVVKAPVRWIRGGPKPGEPEHIWAIRDVSFEIARGEVVGVIGRNGAGKSTLLKVLSRITEPTEGAADIYGSVGSLLEVGTGFHGELTGRENVLLNGAILGMRRSEIDRKFEQILEFSGIDKFIDTPVKRYSSGMQVRLAFAVAAHFEPEIMLIDEVLAVGDADFQRRCLGKLEGLADRGRTVMFVSHSMPSVLRLCPRVILLDKGGVVADGPAAEVIRTYLESGLGTTAAREWSDADAPGDETVSLRSVRITSTDGDVAETIAITSGLDVTVEYDLKPRIPTDIPSVILRFVNEDGIDVFTSTDQVLQDDRLPVAPTSVRTTCHIPGHLLAEGQFSVHVGIVSLRRRELHVREPDAVAFQIVDTDQHESARGEFTQWPGVVAPKLDWSREAIRRA
ncbi:MAG: ABC transporter ATP-binding protein [Actinomycetota bacterium]